MSHHGIVVVGASAGGVEALKALVQGLAPDLPAAVFVVLHHGANAPIVLPSILQRFGPLPASLASDHEEFRPGRIYVAPNDVHLLVNPGETRLSHAPRENGMRPAVDPLFRSAAQAYGPQVIGVVLSGTGDDGTLGLAAIEAHGGITVVQDPADAMFSSMPESAAEHVAVDYSVPAARLGELISRLARYPVPPNDDEAEDEDSDDDCDTMDRPVPIATDRDVEGPAGQHRGHLIPIVCPECGGPLWEERELGLTRYVCLIGHNFSTESLYSVKTAATEAALWAAVRALDERADLARRMARRMDQKHHTASRHRFEETERESRLASDVIRQLLLGGAVSNDLPDAESTPSVEKQARQG